MHPLRNLIDTCCEAVLECLQFQWDTEAIDLCIISIQTWSKVKALNESQQSSGV
jgi:hypothetical protein